MSEGDHPLYTRLMTEQRARFWAELFRARVAYPGERDFVALAAFLSGGSFIIRTMPRDKVLARLMGHPVLGPALADIAQDARADDKVTCLVHVIVYTETEIAMQPVRVTIEASDVCG